MKAAPVAILLTVTEIKIRASRAEELCRVAGGGEPIVQEKAHLVARHLNAIVTKLVVRLAAEQQKTKSKPQKMQTNYS